MRFLFDGHVLDIDQRELRRSGEPIPLEPLVFDLLVHLVANRDRVLSKDDLLDAVWSGRIVSKSALASGIAAVRRAVGDSGEAQKLIRTISRKGFRFIGDVQEDAGAIRVGVEAQPVAPRGNSHLKRDSREQPSIAVLAFANLSSDPEQEYFSDGMADDIITELSQDRSLFVIARDSSFTYKDGSGDVKQIANELSVRYVLDGSVRRSGGRSPRERPVDRHHDRKPYLGQALRPRG